MSSPEIIVDNLTYKFADNLVLDSLSFRVAPGTIMAIIGPNGAGKSTLLKNIIGLYKPTSGRVLIDGKPPQAWQHKIAYVPQRFDFDKSLPLTVWEFMSLEHCGQPGHGSKNISQALAEVSLANTEKKKLGTLSGGQFQRVMIARALLHHKEILVLDEPASGIDLAGEKTIYDLIKDINQRQKTTCLLVSHELSVVNKYATDVLCLNQKMTCFGKPEAIINQTNLEALYGKSAGLYPAHHHHH